MSSIWLFGVITYKCEFTADKIHEKLTNSVRYTLDILVDDYNNKQNQSSMKFRNFLKIIFFLRHQPTTSKFIKFINSFVRFTVYAIARYMLLARSEKNCGNYQFLYLGSETIVLVSSSRFMSIEFSASDPSQTYTSDGWHSFTLSSTNCLTCKKNKIKKKKKQFFNIFYAVKWRDIGSPYRTEMY